MIKDIKIINIIKAYWFTFIKDWITNHFGKNPKKGGNPAKDKKEIINANFKINEWAYKLNNWLIKNNLNWWNNRINPIEIKE